MTSTTRQPGPGITKPVVVPNGGSVQSTSYGMRRSCDACGRRKKKCDGERPCRRCEKARSECTYSKRRWHLTQPEQDGLRLQQVNGDGLHPRQLLKKSASGGLLACHVLPLKRCRLSASPATGLVGMQENTFLSDFFGCVGFLPLTTQSNIRETMVKLMVTSSTSQQTGQGYNYAGPGTIRSASPDSPSCKIGGTADPSTCMFWCAVAMGAILKGSPVHSVVAIDTAFGFPQCKKTCGWRWISFRAFEASVFSVAMFHVSSYLELARGGLGSCSDPMDVEGARACAMLGYLHLFSGNDDMFLEYMGRAESFVNTCIEQGSPEKIPVGFAEMVQHRMTVKVCTGDADAGEVESMCTQEQPLPHLNEVATESELYIYVMRSYRMFEQAVYGAAYRQSAKSPGGPSGDFVPPDEGTRVTPHPISVCEEVVDTMEGRIRQSQYQQLEEAVDRPSIRYGIGALIINGSLMFEKAAKVDRRGILKTASRCIEVFETFPGLCRAGGMGSHLVHIFMTALAAMEGSEAQHLYSTLRAIYNTNLPSFSAPFPPLEEWQGISRCCEYFYCRSMERLILSKGMGFCSMKPDSPRKDPELSDKHVQQNQSGLLSASIISEESASASAQFPSQNWARLDLSSSCTASSMYFLSPGREPQGYATGAALASAAPPLNPKCELQATPAAEVGRERKVVKKGINCVSEIAELFETGNMAPQFKEWAGLADDAGDEDELLDEDWQIGADWLEATHALLAYGENE